MRGMLGHHAQALAMTALVPARAHRPAVRLLAERIEVSQRDEIAQMRRWLLDRGEPAGDPDAGGHGAPGAHDAHEAHGAPGVPHGSAPAGGAAGGGVGGPSARRRTRRSPARCRACSPPPSWRGSPPRAATRSTGCSSRT
jgi:hypothetical protein